MSQSDFGVIDPNTKSGTQLAVDLNGFRDAVNSGHSGSTRPAYLPAGGHWVRVVSSTKWDLVFYDGSVDYTLRSVNPTTGQKIGIPAADLALGTAATATLTTSATDTTAGRVLKVGDFGLGTALLGEDAQLPFIGSLYGSLMAVTMGFYRFDNETIGAPSGEYGVVQVIPVIQAGGFNYIVNVAYSYVSGKAYIRNLFSGAWTPWKEIALTDSPAFTGVPTAPTASAGTNTTQLATTAFVSTALGTVIPGIGEGQTWQDVTGGRASGVTYTNSTGRPIQVTVNVNDSGGGAWSFVLNGTTLSWDDMGGSTDFASFIIPNGNTYQVNRGAHTIAKWMELR